MADDRKYAVLPLSWRETDDPSFPYATQHNGHHLVLRLNDWPDVPYLYTLIVDGKAVLDLEEWPTAWQRP